MRVDTPVTSLTPEGYRMLEMRMHRIRREHLPQLAPLLAERERDERDVAEFERLVAEAEHIESVLGAAELLSHDPLGFDGRVQLGMRVRVRLAEGEECWVRPVHPEEAALDDERISMDSPLAVALLGARTGTSVWVGAPSGVWACNVLEIE